jgi:hypothetical protein
MLEVDDVMLTIRQSEQPSKKAITHILLSLPVVPTAYRKTFLKGNA